MVKKTISKTTHRAWVSMTQLLDYLVLSSRFHGPLGGYMSHAAAWLLQVWRAEIEVQCSIYHFLCSMGVGASSGGMVLVIKRLGFMWVIVHGMQYSLTSYIPMVDIYLYCLIVVGKYCMHGCFGYLIWSCLQNTQWSSSRQYGRQFPPPKCLE